MPTYYDSKNQSYDLTEQIGRGGEGTVFTCPRDYSLVAKIYHEPITREKGEKLRWMADHQNEQLLKFAAWIVDTLHDAPGGEIVGFLMQNVRAKEIHELYSLKSRRVHFPEATWHFLIHTATNVARAFHNLHKHDHVIGDVNHGNCVVLADGTVKMIDCDSYSISTGAVRYACEVGVATHLPPELQRVDLSGAAREIKHDNFGLAVIIFQLLFLGRHPFAGNYLGDEDKSLEDCIREYRFAYGADARARMVRQPPGTLSLSAVSPRVAAMFENAFLTENRPQPREWIEALEDLANNLQVCKLHPGHRYYESLKVCPWCEIEAQTGLLLFPVISSGIAGQVSAEGDFNIFTIENLLATLTVPQNLPIKNPNLSITSAPSPSPDVTAAKHVALKRLTMICVCHFLLLVGLNFAFGAVAATFIGIVVMTAILIFLVNHDSPLRNDVKDNLITAETDWQQLEKEWKNSEINTQFQGNLVKIRQKIGDYQNYLQKSSREIKAVRDTVFRRELENYLHGFPIYEAKLPGIEDQTLRVMRSFGIKTAADIEAKPMNSLPGLDPVVQVKLLDWRKHLERKFEYDENAELPAADRNLYLTENFRTRRHIEKDIESLFAALRAGSTHLHKRQQEMIAESEIISAHLAQSRVDLMTLGSNGIGIAVLIMITILTPLIGGVTLLKFGKNSSPAPAVRRSDAGAAYGSYGSGGGGATSADSATDSADVVSGAAMTKPIPDKMTDEEIAAMTDYEQKFTAGSLYGQGRNFSRNKKDYLRAERKLRLAARITPADARILGELGVVLYEQKKYQESLEFLQKSLVSDSDEEETKLFIGANYLMLKQYENAKTILNEVVSVNSNSFEGKYSLGMAYLGLNDYEAAISNFYDAVNLNPDDADARYQLGFAYFKAGDRQNAIAQYEILRGKSWARAKLLGKVINAK